MLNDTLLRAPRARRPSAAAAARHARRQRTVELRGCAWRPAPPTSPRSPAKKPSSSCRKAAARSPSTDANGRWAGPACSAERATALYVPPGATLRVAAATPLEAMLLSVARRRAGGEAALVAPGRRSGQRARQGQLRARSAQHLRHRSARATADGRRDVQSSRKLEQLSAAQARRARRRAGARRGLLLPHRSRRRGSASRCCTPPTANP